MSGPRVCPTPDKIRYRDRIAATLAAVRIVRRRRDGQDPEQEPYPCAGHWHLRNVAKRRGGAA